MTYLSSAQVEQLLRPINPSRVSVRDGMSHLEAYDVRAHLNRVFGFGRWSADLVELVQLYEAISTKSKDNRTWEVVSVGYRATMRLAVFSPDGVILASYTEAAAGDATNFPINKRADAHDFALKTAESQALKRCAMNLGDQFGLSLYQKGSRDALVRRTLLMPDAVGNPDGDIAHDAAPVTPEHGEEVQPATTSDGSGQATSPETSTSALVESPTPAAPLTSPAAERQAQEALNAQEAQKLRDDAMKVFATRTEPGAKRNEIIQDLGRINITAGKMKVLQEQVRAENGDMVSLQMLLNDLITRCTRSAA